MLALLLPSGVRAAVPATPVMTLYRFNGPLEIPYYDIDSVAKRNKFSPSGHLLQGSSVIPCVVVRNNKPLTPTGGIPFVGFQLVVDAAHAAPDSTDVFQKAYRERQTMTVANHHCGSGVKHVIDVRALFPLDDAPHFDPPMSTELVKQATTGSSKLDQIVRDFHNSAFCSAVNRNLIGRRIALEKAWLQFILDSAGRYPDSELQNAKHLDYAMRTALFEGHLDRGCNAYGGCERDIIALTIRNRAKERCYRYQGCRERGDYQSVATTVTQYNIWDEYLTQITGITSCFLRNDLASHASYGYARLQRMYEQSSPDVERILFGEDADLEKIFAGASLKDLKNLGHYYHAPAMGKCFPKHDRVRYVSGAIARNKDDYILIGNRWIQIEKRVGKGYQFKDFNVEPEDDRDDIKIVDSYPGFVVDGGRLSFPASSRCVPYGIPPGCASSEVGRYRRLPPWHRSGKSIELTCQIDDQGESCQASAGLKSVSVGGPCDKQMRLRTGVR